MKQGLKHKYIFKKAEKGKFSGIVFNKIENDEVISIPEFLVGYGRPIVEWWEEDGVTHITLRQQNEAIQE